MLGKSRISERMFMAKMPVRAETIASIAALVVIPCRLNAVLMSSIFNDLTASIVSSEDMMRVSPRNVGWAKIFSKGSLLPDFIKSPSSAVLVNNATIAAQPETMA